MSGEAHHTRVVEAARAALGLATDRVTGELTIAARGTHLGVPARFAYRIHADGRIVCRVDASLPAVTGFDGRHGWHVDATGLLGSSSLEDLEVARMLIAVWSGRWLLDGGDIVADRGFDPGSGGGSGERRVAGLRVRGGSSPFRVWCDRVSGLPVVLEQVTGHERTWSFGDYRPGPWGRLAHRMRVREGWLEDAVEVTGVTARDAASSYRAVAPPLADTSFDTSGDAAFGALALDRNIADRLGLESRGRAWIVTVDGGAGACHRIGRELRIGPMTVRDPLFIELDLVDLAGALGVRLAGICGYDVLARAICHIRPDPLSVSLLDPADPDAIESHESSAPRAPWVPLEFENRTPLVECDFAGGGPVKLALDTGCSAPVVLFRAALDRWQLPVGRGRPSTARGVTGTRTLRTRRLAWFDCAGVRFERVRASLSDAGPATGRGVTVHPGKLGAVGWGLCRALEVVLDYRRQRASFTRRSP